MALPRLSKRTKAVQLLRRKRRSGEFTGKEDPKSLWAPDPLFKAQKLSNFRNFYHNLRKELVDEHGEVDEGDDDEPTLEELNTRSAKLMTTSNRKKRRVPSGNVQNIEDTIELDDDESDSEEQNLCTRKFKPLLLFSLWKEPVAMVKRVTFSIVLPSGVCVGYLSICVAEDGQYLELSVMWPTSLLDIELMREAMKTSEISPEDALERALTMNEFGSSLKALRANDSEVIQSKALIKMPFVVQSHIHRKEHSQTRPKC